MSIDGGSGFVKQISEGVIRIGIRDGCAAGAEGVGAAKAIVMVIRGRTVSCLANVCKS